MHEHGRENRGPSGHRRFDIHRPDSQTQGRERPAGAQLFWNEAPFEKENECFYAIAAPQISTASQLEGVEKHQGVDSN